MIQFLNSRLKDFRHIQQSSLYPIKEEFERYNIFTGDNYGAMQVNSFEFEKVIKDVMFERKGLMQPMKQI